MPSTTSSSLAQGRELRGVLRRAHDDLRTVPGEPDRDIAGCAVLGDVGQAGQVAGQQLLANRSAQNLGDLVRLHGYFSSFRCVQPPRRRLADLLGQRDDDALGAADVAEPVFVLVLHYFADESGAVGQQAGKDGLDVINGEHDAPYAQRVHGCVRLSGGSRRRVKLG